MMSFPHYCLNNPSCLPILLLYITLFVFSHNINPCCTPPTLPLLHLYPLLSLLSLISLHVATRSNMCCWTAKHTRMRVRAKENSIAITQRKILLVLRNPTLSFWGIEVKLSDKKLKGRSEVELWESHLLSQRSRCQKKSICCSIKSLQPCHKFSKVTIHFRGHKNNTLVHTLINVYCSSGCNVE